MADFATNSIGRTYANASGTVAFDSVAIGVLKVKPSGFSRDTTPVFESGEDEAVDNVSGPKKREAVTVGVSLAIWEVFITANPTYADRTKKWSISVSYKAADNTSCPIDHAQATLTKAVPSEADFGAAGLSMMELEFMPVKATIKNIPA